MFAASVDSRACPNSQHGRTHDDPIQMALPDHVFVVDLSEQLFPEPFPN
jgi:hypothetical protein